MGTSVWLHWEPLPHALLLHHPGMQYVRLCNPGCAPCPRLRRHARLYTPQAPKPQCGPLRIRSCAGILPSVVFVTAGYSVPTNGWVINQVPIVMFLLTHPYFLSYHTLATCVLRRAGFYNASTTLAYRAVLVAGLAYTTAFLEAWSISSFPHYVGCLADLAQ